MLLIKKEKQIDDTNETNKTLKLNLKKEQDKRKEAEERVERRNHYKHDLRDVEDEKDDLLKARVIIEEKDEKYNKILVKNEIEKRNLLNELLQSKNEAEELGESILKNSDEIKMETADLHFNSGGFSGRLMKRINHSKI